MSATGEEINLVPSFIALGAGLAGGLVLIVRQGAAGEGRQSDTAIVDLEEQVEHAVLLMRDLESHRDRLDPDSYRLQRQKLEAEAAEAMRLRDAKIREQQEAVESVDAKRGAEMGTEGDAVVGFFERRPELKGFLWGALLFSAVFGLYLSVVQESQPRATGQSITGNSVPAAAATPKENPELRELLNKLKEDPEHVPSMVRLGKILLFQQMHKEAAMVTERAMQIAPKDSGVLVNHAMVRAAQGDKQGALATLDSVLKSDDTFYDAWFFKGMLSMQSGDSEGMKTSFEKFVAHAPESPKRDRIKKMLEGGGMQMPGAILPARSNQ